MSMELTHPAESSAKRVATVAAVPSTHQRAPFDWSSLARYLANHGLTLDLSIPAKQFTGGFGNLNYLVHVNGQPHVLRRPPLGEVPRGANDMAREHRVLAALHEAFPLAPRSVHYCPDPGPIGAHFQLLEYREGLIIGPEMPPGVNSAEAGPGLSHMLVTVLASLHAIDVEETGLGNLGRPEGFLHRASQGWAQRAAAVTPEVDRTIIAELSRWLSRNEPPQRDATVLHCDFKLDNLILAPKTLKPRAVLDWDMATRGDPLFDLGTLLSYWVEAEDPPAMHELKQMPTALPGFSRRAQIMAEYSRLTGRDLSDFLFYRVLTLFKLGVVFHQLHARFRSGATADPRFAAFGALASGILDFAHGVMKGRNT